MNGKVGLEGLEFHAFHGVYRHERESGNWFEIDIAVETDFSAAAENDDLAGTVNYEALFQIVKEKMEEPSKLLETVANKIASDVLARLPSVSNVELKIAKLNPPIGGKCNRAIVWLSKQRSQPY
jgi:dihydroneopterin aldolase